MSEDDGRASGHARDNPPPPDMSAVVLLWTLLISWLTLTVFALVLIMTGATRT